MGRRLEAGARAEPPAVPRRSTRSPTAPSTSGVLNALPRHRRGRAYFTRPGRGAGVQGGARHRHDPPTSAARLLFVGVPCYPIFRRFSRDVRRAWRRRSSSSTYLWFASGGAEPRLRVRPRPSPREPRRRRADRRARRDGRSCSSPTGAAGGGSSEFGADGIVYHPIKSCRTVSHRARRQPPRADGRQRDIPCLFIESDMMDQRVVSEAQMKNRIDAFFEGLATRARRVRKAGETPHEHTRRR